MADCYEDWLEDDSDEEWEGPQALIDDLRAELAATRHTELEKLAYWNGEARHQPMHWVVDMHWAEVDDYVRLLDAEGVEGYKYVVRKVPGSVGNFCTTELSYGQACLRLLQEELVHPHLHLEVRECLPGDGSTFTRLPERLLRLESTKH